LGKGSWVKVSARIREKEEAGKGDSLLWIDVRVVDEVWVDVGRHVGGECGWEKTGRMEESRKTDAECNLARNIRCGSFTLLCPPSFANTLRLSFVHGLSYEDLLHFQDQLMAGSSSCL